MRKNTSISLGNYFESFVENRIAEGRYKNVSEVICAGLRLLEEEENRLVALKSALNDGINSGIAGNYNPKKHLEILKASKHRNS